MSSYDPFSSLFKAGLLCTELSSELSKLVPYQTQMEHKSMLLSEAQVLLTVSKLLAELAADYYEDGETDPEGKLLGSPF